MHSMTLREATLQPINRTAQANGLLSFAGITPDTLLRALRSTVFNPVLTVPLLLAARFTQQGKVLAANHALVAKYLRTAAVLGILNRLGAWLDDAVTNNWTNDFYDWKKEVVVVTGGSDGIGKEVVLLLAEKDIKVAVLDVQGLTYEGEFLPAYIRGVETRTVV